MIVLIGLIVILQCFFYMLFKPFIDFSTLFFDFRFYLVLLLFLGTWLFSGKEARDIE
tara:strand:- start:54 stop:224 length:171 start_codon:yes stop_codon:yes gene_type:complete